MSEFKLFLIRKSDEWFLGRGSWGDDIKKARKYKNIGPARAVISQYIHAYPHDTVPEIVEFKMTETTIHDETARIKEQIKKKNEAAKKYKLEIKKQNVEDAKRQLKLAEQKLKDAEKEI